MTNPKGDLQTLLFTKLESENSAFLVMLSIGPVQDFIAEARKTRDLWAGSYILSMFALEVMKALKEEAIFIYPDFIPQKACSTLQYATLPNHLLAVIPSSHETKLKQVMNVAQKAVEQYWIVLSKKVYLRTEPILAAYGTDELLWVSQTAKHFNLAWVALPVSKKEIIEEFASSHELIQKCMEERKITRIFEQHAGSSAFKCRQCGHREILGPIKETRDFWRDLRASFSSYIKDGEKLCAICLTKRLSLENDISSCLTKIPFDSTSDIASRHYRDSLKKNAADTAVKGLVNSVNRLCKALKRKGCGKIDTIPGDFFYMDSLSMKNLKKEFRIHEASENEIDLKAESLKKCLSLIHKEYGVEPCKYLALVTLDGDRIGKALSSMGSLTEQADFSTELSRLGGELLPAKVASWKGHTIYSGGDDLLAIGPLKGCITVAEDLRLCFSNNLGRELTCSVGVVIFHHQSSLRRALEEGRKTLDRAKKEYGRNAIAVTALLSSGNVMQSGCKWDLPGLSSSSGGWNFVEFYGLFIKWLSERKYSLSIAFVHDLLGELPAFYFHDNGNATFSTEMFKIEAKRLMDRHMPKTSRLRIAQFSLITDEFLNMLSHFADPGLMGKLDGWNVVNTLDNFEATLRIATFIARQEIEEN